MADEVAAQKAAKEYSEAINEYGLDNIVDGWGQGRKRYMIDAFYAGFYAGRDSFRDSIPEDLLDEIMDRRKNDIS